jgi:hypothetical protein
VKIVRGRPTEETFYIIGDSHIEDYNPLVGCLGQLYPHEISDLRWVSSADEFIEVFGQPQFVEPHGESPPRRRKLVLTSSLVCNIKTKER